MTDIREKLLDATAQVFAKLGYLGCTTRRVAQEAGVNEVTLFRHFGSKDTLIREALAHVERTTVTALPGEPKDPAAELHAWAHEVYGNLSAQRVLIAGSSARRWNAPRSPPWCARARTGSTASSGAISRSCGTAVSPGRISAPRP